MSRVIVLGTSAMFPLPRTVNNKFSDYFDIDDYTLIKNYINGRIQPLIDDRVFNFEDEFDDEDIEFDFN